MASICSIVSIANCLVSDIVAHLIANNTLWYQLSDHHLWTIAIDG